MPHLITAPIVALQLAKQLLQDGYNAKAADAAAELGVSADGHALAVVNDTPNKIGPLDYPAALLETLSRGSVTSNTSKAAGTSTRFFVNVAVRDADPEALRNRVQVALLALFNLFLYVEGPGWHFEVLNWDGLPPAQVAESLWISAAGIEVEFTAAEYTE